MVEEIEALFPGLKGTAYQVTSLRDPAYNCIAWAAGHTDGWWWPDEAEDSDWPDGVTRAETLAAFLEAFAALGYVVCDSAEHERGFEKVALFAQDNIPTHAARQLPNGRWTSKLGRLEDIEHRLHDLVGKEYGSVVLIGKRSFPPSA